MKIGGGQDDLFQKLKAGGAGKTEQTPPPSPPQVGQQAKQATPPDLKFLQGLNKS